MNNFKQRKEIGMKKKTEFNTQNQGDSVYLVTVTETLTRTVVVRTDDEDKAREIIEREYENGHIVLDYDDFDEWEINTRKHRDEDLSLYEEIETE